MIEPTRFDRDTAVEQIGDESFRARIDRGWWIINGPNGGYVAAIVLRAMILCAGDESRAPRSLTIHYLRPPAEGPVEIVTKLERAGRTLSNVSARLIQGDRLLALAIGAFAQRRVGFEFCDVQPPALPPPEQCARIRDDFSAVEMHHRYDSRIPAEPPGTRGSDGALIQGWIRLVEPRRVDAVLAAAMTDAFVPAVFKRPNSSVSGPIPTVDLTIHFRAELPLPDAAPEDFYAAAFRTTAARDGFIEEDGELWSDNGVLIAQSRQLAILGS